TNQHDGAPPKCRRERRIVRRDTQTIGQPSVVHLTSSESRTTFHNRWCGAIAPQDEAVDQSRRGRLQNAAPQVGVPTRLYKTLHSGQTTEIRSRHLSLGAKDREGMSK